MRSAAPRPVSVWAPPVRPRRARFRRPSLWVPVRGDVLLALILLVASVLGTAWAATSPGSARVGIMLGALAFVMLCGTLLLSGWSALQARALAGLAAGRRIKDGAQNVAAHGRWFAGWFAAQQLAWSALGLALAAGLLLPRGATFDLALATVGGLLTVAACGLLAAISAGQPLLTGQAAALAACWRSPVPHGLTTHGARAWLARGVALLLLPTRLAQVRRWDGAQPQPFLRKIVQVSEDARRGGAGYLLDVRPVPGVTWRAELPQRAAVYLVIWLLGALVALIALRAGLIGPIVPALIALTGADPLAQTPESQAPATPEADAGGGGGGSGGSDGGGGNAGGGQGAGSASGPGAAGQSDGDGEGERSASGAGGAGDGQGDGQGSDGAGGSGGGGSGDQGQSAGGQSSGQRQQGQQPGQQGQSGGAGQGAGQQQGSGQQGQGQESGQQGESGGGQDQQGGGEAGGGEQAGPQDQQDQGQEGQGQQGPGERSQAQAGGGQQPEQSQGAGGGSQQGQRAESDDTQQGESRGGSDRPGDGAGGPGSTRGGDPIAPPTPPQLGAPTPVQPPAAQSTDDIVSIELPAIGPGQQAQGTPQPAPGTPLPAQPGRTGPQGPNASGTAAQGARSAGQPLPPWIQSLLDGAGSP